MLEALTSFGVLLSLIRPGGRQAPRLVKRTSIDCPHGRGKVDVALLTGRLGRPKTVLACSAEASRPPACDQACRDCVEAVLGPAYALVLYPPGDAPFDDAD
jgi:hypothetical protein